MTVLMIAGALLGATLGLRFKVLVLLPATLMGVAGIAAFAMLHGGAMTSTVGSMVVWATTLQLGYLIGLLVRFVLVASRASHPGSNLALLARSRSRTRAEVSLL